MKDCTIEEFLVENGIKYTKAEVGEFTKFVIQHLYSNGLVTSEILYVLKGRDNNRILYTYICKGEQIIYDVLDCDKVLNCVLSSHNMCLNTERG